MAASMTIEAFPLTAAKKVHMNLLETPLIERAIALGEGRFASTGAFTAQTGVHTGRSPQDKVHGPRRVDRERDMVGQ